jgi:hypothetical protein
MERDRKTRGSGVEGGYTVRAQKGRVIAKISSAVWGDGSGRIGMRHTSCVDRTSNRKRSFLVDVDAGTYIGHPKTWVRRMRKEGQVVESRMGW